MRVIITGHTGGLGLAFFNYFTERGDEVIGASRSNGYTMPDKFDQVLDLTHGADLFVNNLHYKNIQTSFVTSLYNKLPIISCGSMAADYSKTEFIDYSISKKQLEIEHKKFKKISPFPMLLLKMGFLENWKEYDSIPYQQIINSVGFWLENPRASIIEFDNINYHKKFTK